MNEYEVIVIGGGPAGLSAALYLARFDRQVALFDAGHGRSTWHQVAYNYLGFPGGVRTRRLRELGYEQLADYPQVHIFRRKIENLRREHNLFFAGVGSEVWCNRAVILCTGVEDHYPQFKGWEDCIGRSMFWCITCDGYESKGKQVVVVGNTNDTASIAMQMQRFTRQVTVVTNSAQNDISENFVRRLQLARIPIIEDRIVDVEGQEGMVRVIHLQNGARLMVDRLFSHQEPTPQTDLATQIGVQIAKNGYILVDTEQKTSVSGVFAAGDVTRLHSHQISTAVHEGGMAASAANYYLYPPELKDE